MAKLAVLFPGIGYTCDKPILYYAEDLAVQSGYECKRIAYARPGDMRIRGDLEKMEEAFRILYGHAEDCLSNVAWEGYEEVLLISKSIGTVIAAAYAKKLAGMRVRHVLYTPLEQTFSFRPENAIGFIGTADSWCDPSEVLRLAKEQGIPMHVYVSANHSLEVGDTVKDLDTLRNVMEKTQEFILGKE